MRNPTGTGKPSPAEIRYRVSSPQQKVEQRPHEDLEIRSNE